MRNRLLISAALLAGTLLSATAANESYNYYYTDPEYGRTNVIGTMRRVSDNGVWAVGGDYADESGCFYVNTATPENLVRIPDGELMDASDNGIFVGAWHENQGTPEAPVNYAHAAIYKDGAWQLLPEPESQGLRSYAVSITPDGKRIAGHYFAVVPQEISEIGAAYYPVVWDWDEAAQKYVVRDFLSIQLPNHQGFFVQDMTPDGSLVVGYVFCGAGSTIPCALKVDTADFMIWNELVTVSEPWYYKGEIMGYSDEYYIDGYHDGADGEYFNGAFTYATNDKIFGYRTVATDVTEEGGGILTIHSTVYDVASDTFEDSDYGMFTCGANDKTIFGVSISGFSPTPFSILDGKYSADVAGALDVTFHETFAGIMGISYDGTVLVGSSQIFNEVMGEYVEIPLLIVLDNSVSAVREIATAPVAAKVSVAGNTISVDGAASVKVFNVSGAAVSSAAKTVVAPGVYVVVADGVAYKVVVR